MRVAQPRKAADESRAVRKTVARRGSAEDEKSLAGQPVWVCFPSYNQGELIPERSYYLNQVAKGKAIRGNILVSGSEDSGYSFVFGYRQDMLRNGVSSRC